MKVACSLVALVVLGMLPAAVGAQQKDRPARRDRNLITDQEIEQNRTRADNAYDLISALRPQWLRTRGNTTLVPGVDDGVALYVDGTRRGSVEELRSVPVEHLTELRYVSAGDATTRYGTGHAQGAIEVSTRR
jgi:hypothetical protein